MNKTARYKKRIMCGTDRCESIVDSAWCLDPATADADARRTAIRGGWELVGDSGPWPQCPGCQAKAKLRTVTDDEQIHRDAVARN